MKHRYLIALGSNVRHSRYGAPDHVLRSALRHLGDDNDIAVKAVSRIIRSAALGPSRREYANAAAVIRSKLKPQKLLDRLKKLERHFGRRSTGRRWSARVLDLDIVLWDGGCWASDDLTVPHPAFRTRRFVVGPAATIARQWRDPLSGLTLGQLQARLTKPRPIRNDPAWSGP